MHTHEAHPAPATPPCFSLIIPTFNYGRYLPRAIESALAQDGADFEVIVADDGSTDDTPAVLAAFGDRITVITQSNAGPFSACRAGLLRARGQRIIFFDADDRLEPGALASIRRAVTADPAAGVVVGPWRSIDRHGRSKPDPFTHPSGDRLRDFERFLTGRMRFTTGAAAIRRSALQFMLDYRRAVPVGMESIVLAHLLLREKFAVADQCLQAVHDHEGRLRHGVSRPIPPVESLVRTMFDPALASPEVMHLAPVYRAYLLREHTRVCYHQRRYAEASRAFLRAAAADRRSLADLRNLRRALISAALRPFAASNDDRDAGDRAVAACPPGRLFGGHRAQYIADPMGFVRRMAHQYGDVVRLRLPRPTYLLSHPDDVRHVLATNSDNYARHGFIRAWQRYLGRGLISDEPPSHTDQRRLLNPLFQPRAAAQWVPAAMTAVGRESAAWPRGQPVNIAASLLEAMRRFASHMVLGLPDAGEHQALHDWSVRTHFEAVKIHQCPFRLPRGRAMRQHREQDHWSRRCEELLARIVDQRRRSGDDRSDDALSAMLKVQREQPGAIDEPMLIDHLKTLLAASVEPNVAPTSFALWRLSRHPDLAQRVAAEADAVLGVRAPGPDDLPRLVYAGMFWRETLRLHPSNWVNIRTALGDDRLPGGLRIPAGSDVFISQYAAHMDARNFPDPERFDPARFEAAAVASRPRMAWLPFGFGPRACAGAALAEAVGIATLAMLARDFTFEDVPGPAPSIESPNCTIGQIKDLRLVLIPRPRSATAQTRASTAAPVVRAAGVPTISR